MVLFDFPRDGVEYVRRVGRATRGAHQPGRVTSLLLGRQVRYNPLAHAGHAREERRRALGCAWGGERLGPAPSRWPLEPVRFAPPGPAGKGGIQGPAGAVPPRAGTGIPPGRSLAVGLAPQSEERSIASGRPSAGSVSACLAQCLGRLLSRSRAGCCGQ